MNTQPMTLTICDNPFTGTIRRDEYIDSGAAALLFTAKDGVPIATLSVNVPGHQLRGNFTAIKDYSENAGVLAQLVEKKIVRDTGTRIRSSFVTIPVVEIIEPTLMV